MNAFSAEEESIRSARHAQNQAIASDDLDRVASFWTEDVTVRRALGQSLEGKEAARKVMEPADDPARRIVYQRLSVEVEVSQHWSLAYEEGRWSGHLGNADGPVVISGRYAAQWVKRDGQWLIRSELFVALDCAGIGCEFVALA